VRSDVRRTVFHTQGELFYLLRRNRKFPEEVAKFYAAEILMAIEYLHSRNIIYRDLKPENILLDQEGHIKITDFGLSKVCASEKQLTYSVCGTPEYIAPEVMLGKGYGQSADWFSFVYYLLYRDRCSTTC
jgi:serine/threonine protein kinase